MSSQVDAWQSLVDACRIDFASAPDLFSRLWQQGRLSYEGRPVAPGGIDELTARLIVAVVARRGRLLVALPDENPRRPAVIFGSALLATSIETLLSKARGVTVLLIGSSVEIRNHVGATRVQHLVLSSVFPQVHLQSDSKHALGQADVVALARHLPKVISVLSPKEPVKVLEKYRPQWIAVECSRDRDSTWLEGVAEWAQQRRVPLVGWVSGIRSAVISSAKKNHIPVYQWPLLSGDGGVAERDTAISGKSLVQAERKLAISPILMHGANSHTISASLAKANISLAQCQATPRSSTADDCVRLAWRYLRTIENLPVPVSFYEHESGAFWGLRPLGQLSETTHRFAAAIKNTDASVAQLVQRALSEIDSTVERMRTVNVPMWNGLRTLCIATSARDRPRSIVFPTISRRRLFELALLGLEGITQNDLADVGVQLADIAHPSALLGKEFPTASVTFTGLPTLSQLPGIHGIADNRTMEALLYPHQGRILQTRVQQYAADSGIHATDQLRALREAGATVNGDVLELQSEIKITEARVLPVQEKEEQGSDVPKPQWNSLFNQSEIHSLLEVDVDEADETVVADIPSDDTQIENEIAVEKVVELAISGRQKGLFSPDYVINLVRMVDARETILERTVRAVRVGDRLVLVHGQRRQSLYELLLSRVHRHPTLQLHLALIKTWQDEIAICFLQWRQANRKGFGELLVELQSSGSAIQSPLALRFWTAGKVLAPHDEDDLPRIARILGMKFTAEHHSRIAKAAERLRTLHRGLALRLNHWLRREASGAVQEGDDEVIDAELGLMLRDFKDSLEVVTVEACVERRGLFLLSTLNSFRPY